MKFISISTLLAHRDSLRTEANEVDKLITLLGKIPRSTTENESEADENIPPKKRNMSKVSATDQEIYEVISAIGRPLRKNEIRDALVAAGFDLDADKNGTVLGSRLSRSDRFEHDGRKLWSITKSTNDAAEIAPNDLEV